MGCMPQPWQVQIKLAKLPNPHNSIYKELRSEDNCKKQWSSMESGFSEWAASGQVAQALAAKHFGI